MTATYQHAASLTERPPQQQSAPKNAQPRRPENTGRETQRSPYSGANGYYKPGELVKQSNTLVRATLPALDATAAKIFAVALGRIRRDDDELQDCRIPVRDIIPRTSRGGTAYQRIKKGLKALLAAQAQVKQPGTDKPVSYPLTLKAAYEKGVVLLRVHPQLAPYLLNLGGHFTTYTLRDFTAFSSRYSRRLFELLLSYKSLAQITLPLQTLHTLCNSPDSLRRDFAQFRRRVLEQAHKDIHKHTDLRYEWEPAVSGRTVSGVCFIFSKGLRRATENGIAKGYCAFVARKGRDKRKHLNTLFMKAVLCAKAKTSPCPSRYAGSKRCALCASMNLLKTP